MKEIQHHTPDNIINVRSQDQESQEKLIGRIIPENGHTLWEVNMTDQSISKAEFEDTIVEVINADKKEFIKRKKVIHKPNCCYVSCLNKRNIPKHLKRNYGVDISLNE